MDVLHRGSRGFKVKYLQRLLNSNTGRTSPQGPWLVEDGVFGQHTEDAVNDFQDSRADLTTDGRVGPATWTALGLRVEREHRRVLQFGQPDNTSCWSAAASSILGNVSVGPGAANAIGGLEATIDNLAIIAQGLGWTMLNHSPGNRELVDLVNQKPLWIGATGEDFGHAVVLSGVYSTGGANGVNTMFRIHDPWPPNRGSVYGSFANPLMINSFYGGAPMRATNFLVMIPN